MDARNPAGGLAKQVPLDMVGEVRKTKAHRSDEQAAQAGDQHDRRHNGFPDRIAKRAVCK